MKTKTKALLYLVFSLIGQACNSGDDPQNPDPDADKITSGLRVENGKLLDAAGEEFIPYGVNSIHIWLDEQSSVQALETEIAKSGANTVRLVTSGSSWTWNSQSRQSSQKRRLVEKAIEAGLVPMIEMHDGTCVEDCDLSPADGKMGLEQIVDEWLEPENLRLLKDYEDKLLLNIANEWGPNSEVYLECYKNAITRLREAGVRNVLVIDAGGNCGQDPHSLLSYGNELFRHDPLHNIVLSIHLYGFWRTEDKSFTDWTPPFLVEEMIPQLAALDAPVVVGEFGWTGEGSAVNYNPEKLMEVCHREGIGWYFWAWNDGISKPFYSLSGHTELAFEDHEDLTEAGRFIINDPALGFKAIAKAASGFSSHMDKQ